MIKRVWFVLINIYCEQSELFSIFLFEQIEIGDKDNVGTITLRDGSEIKFERHKFGHINEVVIDVKSNNNGVAVFKDVANHPNMSIFNPKPNSIIIFDRWWIERNFTFIYSDNDENLYKSFNNIPKSRLVSVKKLGAIDIISTDDTIFSVDAISEFLGEE